MTRQRAGCARTPHPPTRGSGAIESLGAMVSEGGKLTIWRPMMCWAGRKAIGADTRGVLRDCGYSDAEIDRLARDGVIKAP